MGEPSSDDWLPPGWAVEMKHTSSGRKYKCYIQHSSGIKFYSKPQVSRYLMNAPLSDFESAEEKSIEKKTSIKTEAPTGTKASVEKKKHSRGVARKVVFERIAAEGLPPGWIKEIKIQCKHGIVRRDPFYIDPVSGYIFRSMKDTLRYIKTGDPGRLAIKPKPRDSRDMNLGDDKTSSLVIPKKQELAGGGERRQNRKGQSLKLGKMASDEGTKSACLEECLPNTEHTSDQSTKDAEKSSLYLSEAKGSEHIGGRSGDAKNVSDSAPLVEPLAEKHRGKVCGKRKKQPSPCNSRNRKCYDLPRRASKRLAGIEVDVTPELKTTNRGHRVAEIEAGMAEPEAKSSFQSSPKMQVLSESTNVKTPIEDLAPPAEQAERIEADSKDKETPAQHAGVTEHENKAAQNPEPHQDLPFGNSWTDPCIEFAIKTLTSDHLSIEDYFQQQLSSPLPQSNNVSNLGLGNLQNIDFPFQQYDVAENPSPVRPIFPPDGNITFPSSGETGGYQPDEVSNMASLKIPPQTDNGFNLGFSDFHQTDLSFQPHIMAGNPAPKSQAPVEPIFQPAGNANFLSSGGNYEDKSKELQGTRIQQEGNIPPPSEVQVRPMVHNNDVKIKAVNIRNS